MLPASTASAAASRRTAVACGRVGRWPPTEGRIRLSRAAARHKTRNPLPPGRRYSQQLSLLIEELTRRKGGEGVSEHGVVGQWERVLESALVPKRAKAVKPKRSRRQGGAEGRCPRPPRSVQQRCTGSSPGRRKADGSTHLVMRDRRKADRVVRTGEAECVRRMVTVLTVTAIR